jgi:hypothetical protein
MMSGICYADNQRFIFLGENSTSGRFYFDTETVKFGRNANGVVDPMLIDVWTKLIYSEKGKQFVINASQGVNGAPNFEDLRYNFRHNLLDMKQYKYMNLGVAFYGDNGLITNEPDNSQKWNDIIPESTMEINAGIIGKWILNNWDMVMTRSK